MHRSTCTMTGHQRVSCRAHHGLKSGIAARITRGPSYVTARPTRIGAIRIPLYSTLSALCYNSMPIPRFQSVPRLCLFYAWLPVCQSPQGIMPGHHFTQPVLIRIEALDILLFQSASSHYLLLFVSCLQGMPGTTSYVTTCQNWRSSNSWRRPPVQSAWEEHPSISWAS